MPTRPIGVGTGIPGDILYQQVGGFTPGIVYDLLVDGTVQSSYTAQSGTMLPTHGTTGYVWFNYTGGWSTHLFTVRTHSVADGGGDGGETSDTGTTTLPEPYSTPGLYGNPALIALVVIGILSVLLLVFGYKKK